MIIPVQRAMQGHPEAPRLWENNMIKILRELGFQMMMHEPYCCKFWLRPQLMISNLGWISPTRKQVDSGLEGGLDDLESCFGMVVELVVRRHRILGLCY